MRAELGRYREQKGKMLENRRRKADLSWRCVQGIVEFDIIENFKQEMSEYILIEYKLKIQRIGKML